MASIALKARDGVRRIELIVANLARDLIDRPRVAQLKRRAPVLRLV